MERTKELQDLEKSMFESPDTGDALRRIAGKFDYDIGKIVIEDLVDIYDKTKDASAVNEVARVLEKYSDEYVRGAGFYLSCVATYAGSNAVKDATRVLEKYNDLSGLYVSNVFSRVSVVTRDENTVRNIASAMNEDDVVNVIKKFEADCGEGCFTEHDILREFLNGLGEVAMFTTDPEAVRNFVRVVGDYKQYERFIIKGLVRPLATIASHTKDADAIKCTIKVIESCEGYGGMDIAKSLKDIAEKIDDGSVIKKFAKLAGRLYERSTATARDLLRNAEGIYTLFGSKYEDILNYLERRKDRESLKMIENVYNKINVSKQIKKLNMGKFGNKQAMKLIKYAAYLGYNYQLGLNPDVSDSLQISFTNVENSLRDYLNKLDIKDIDKGMKFLLWLVAKDKTALKVLRGEKVEKNGIVKTYELKSKSEINLDDLRRELQSYAQMAKLGIFVGYGDLIYLKTMAQTIMSEVDKKNDLNESILGEVKPNLSRILNLTHKAGRNYTLHVDPSDLESQMEALQNIPSCLSPGGITFEFAQRYLANPDTFWAVIKDGEDIVGRVTVFMGKDENQRKRLTRASAVYSNVPISKRDVDEALEDYAKMIGAEFMKKGRMSIENLERIYDDYARGEGEIISVMVPITPVTRHS